MRVVRHYTPCFVLPFSSDSDFLSLTQFIFEIRQGLVFADRKTRLQLATVLSELEKIREVFPPRGFSQNRGISDFLRVPLKGPKISGLLSAGHWLKVCQM